MSGRRPGVPAPAALAELLAHERCLPAPLRVEEPPSRLKRLVFLRAGGICSVCGCSSRLFLHVHHIIARWRGGGNHPENLYLACSACHGLLHSVGWRLAPRGRARLEGRLLTLEGARNGSRRPVETSGAPSRGHPEPRFAHQGVGHGA